MRKTILLSGLIIGLLISANFFISEGLFDGNWNKMEIFGFLTMFLAFGIGLFLSLKKIDAANYSGHINFSQAFIASFYIILLVTVVYTLMWEIDFRSSDGSFVDAYLDHSKQEMVDRGLSEEEIETNLEQQKQVMIAYKNETLVRIGITASEIFPVGLIMALLMSFVVSYLARRRENLA